MQSKLYLHMIKLKIDNIGFEAEDGDTIFSIASKAGITIPVLCHKAGVEHYSSCMVCMVKDNTSGRFLPSCSALAQDGMDIDASGEDVITLRKKAVELLLSEHRAECEAPCRVVCPGGYNIPLMNRYLMSGQFDEAFKLTVSEINTPDILCVGCPGYCENACRRKKMDNPVSIRNIKLFITKDTYPSERNQVHASSIEELIKESRKALKTSRKFSSHIGKQEPGEITQMLKESINNSERHREISDHSSASEEAGSCMHCDCRAADDCRLRDLAEALSVKDPRSKIINSPAVKKINPNTGLIFENAKCIKCGLCVRICEDSTNEPVLCFINRGFISIISEPLTEEFDNVLKNKAGECINICPTGALSYFK
jgi:ferredoxin